jgi:hypothetical protein
MRRAAVSETRLAKRGAIGGVISRVSSARRGFGSVTVGTKLGKAGGAGIATVRRSNLWAETLAWIVAIGLLSPLLIYAKSGWMPLAALYGVAGGIALALMLVGRRLYDVLIADALSGRQGSGSFLVTVGLILVTIVLVVLGAAVALVYSLRETVKPSPF